MQPNDEIAQMHR